MEHPIDGKDSGGEQTGSNFEREFQSTRQAVFGERQIFNLKDRETVPEEFPYFGSRAREIYGKDSIFGRYLPTYVKAEHGSYTGWVIDYGGYNFAYLDNGAPIYKEKMTRNHGTYSPRQDQIFYKTVWVGEGSNNGKTIHDTYEWYFFEQVSHCVLIGSIKKELTPEKIEVVE